MKLLVLLAVVAAVSASDVIDGEYILRLRADVNDAEITTLFRERFNTEAVKFFHFRGATIAHVKAQQADAERLQWLSDVVSVEPNQLFYATQSCAVEAHPGVWGLDRIDQSTDFPPGYTAADAQYDHGMSDGTGVNAYIVDTGIRLTHVEFGGRATWGYDAITPVDSPQIDDNGHGTHCAGTVGSDAYGVAKGANLIAVKVLNSFGSGSTAQVIDGIEFVSGAGGKEGGHVAGDKSVINLSLGGGPSPSLDTAIDEAVDAGVVVVAAAGNSNADACNSSPGGTPRAITVGATEIDDESATYTNYGPCVDIYAPGTNILSTWYLSDTDTATISGTSMACPHVVGAVARYQSSHASAPAPVDVSNYIIDSAVRDTINFRPIHNDTSANLFLYSPCVLSTA